MHRRLRHRSHRRWSKAAVALAFLTSTAFSQFTAVSDAGVAIWSPSSRTITETLVNDAHAAGLSLATWTVNSEDEIREVISIGVDGIITDRPDIALDIVAQG